MQYRNYTQDQFIDAVAKACSIRQVLLLLGLKPAGGNYCLANARIKKLKLDISHFTGMSWSKGKTIGPKAPISEYLSNKREMTSCKLKHRLFKEGLLEWCCSSCGLSTWLDKPIPTELHHIDGNRKNNNLDNLLILCPNCHALTPNYRGKNIGKVI